MKQTVSLNTPGKQDGEFSLDVNGKRAIYRNDVLYRENLSEVDAKTTKTRKTILTTKTKTKTRKLSKPITTTTDTSSADDGGILGPLLSEILGGLRRRDFDVGIGRTNKRDLLVATTNTVVVGQQLTSIEPQPTPTNPVPTMTSFIPPISNTTGDNPTFGIEATKETEVKFSGIFFR